MAPATPRFILLRPTNLNCGTLRGSGASVDEPLVPSCELPTNDTDRVKFVDLFSNGQEMGNRPKRFPTKVHVRPCDNDTPTLIRQEVDHPHNPTVEKLRLVDGYYLGIGLEALHEFG